MELNDEELEHFKRNIRQYIRPTHIQRESLVLA
jgi:hypothetical protein